MKPRKRGRVFAVGALGAVFAAGVLFSSLLPTARAHSCGWAGTWLTNYGHTLTWVEAGGRVSGTWITDATVNGNVLRGTYNDGTRSGAAEFTLSADGNSWSGWAEHAPTTVTAMRIGLCASTQTTPTAAVTTTPTPPPPTTSTTSSTQPVVTEPAVTTPGVGREPPPGKADVVPTGTVLVKPPGAIEPITITGETRVPNGTEVDVIRGKITLETSYGSGGVFWAGRFVLVLGRESAAIGLTVLRLTGGDFRKACAKALRRTVGVGKSRKPVRSLSGKADGGFRTQGRFASATVRGTPLRSFASATVRSVSWLTQDRCDGTLVRVHEGQAEVLDFKRQEKVLVKAGGSYLAKAP